MDFLPLFFNLKDRPALVVGGGDVAARKARLLKKAGAKVTIVAPEIVKQLVEQVEAGELEFRQGEFSPADLEDMVLVVAATNDQVVNRGVSASARKMNLPVNVVDQPELSSFIFPAVIDRSPLVAAVSSGGRAPVLTRLLRARLETLIPSGYGRLAELAGNYRDQVKQKLEGPQRRRFWEKVFQGPVAESILSGQKERAGQLLERELEGFLRGEEAGVGEVYLVGAGPGDPDLLTFRALRLMQQADVIVHDRLVSPAVLDLARRDAELIYVGKERSNHSVPQGGINQLLVDLAKQGKKVLRLKGGDPFIFGRGGEEIETLAGQGIPFQVVPGITAASGCAAYAGIPLTHRDHAQACLLVTGHLKDGSVNLNWQQLAKFDGTIAVYMGLLGLSTISEQLIRHGMDSNTPAALIEKGTLPEHRVLTGTLGTLPEIVGSENVSAPTMLIIGSVVRLRDRLSWFNPAPIENSSLPG